MSASDEQYKKKLIERYVAGEASEKELQAFFGMLTEAEIDGLIEEHMDQEILRLREEQHLLTPVKRIKIWKYAAVVAGFLLISYGGYYIFRSKPAQQTAQNQIHDLPPGSDKAILKTHGRQISITDAKNGLVAQMGTTSIIKTGGGKLVYNNKSAGNIGAMIYDTLIVPRGGQHLLQLADGSKILLDADSKLRFPERFASNERKIELISGHGRFYVHHDAAISFLVTVKGETMKDIGTDFDISAYDNEGPVKTTLVEGSVSVSSGSHSIILKPGQQSSLIENQFKVQNVDVDNVIAWSNGFFAFKQADVKTVMRQFSRWYDVDVEYKGQVPATMITGKAYRNVNASEALTILTDLGIHYKIIKI